MSKNLILSLCFTVFFICCPQAFALYNIQETEITDQGFWHKQLIYYPQPSQIKDPMPIVIISHGNGHNYTYYKYLQKHLARLGYLTMSHTNNTGPGIETASSSTLENTDTLLEKLDSIDGEALKGQYDSSRIAWIGHSRGGEGVVRAYTRLLNKDYLPKTYTAKDIQFISSIAPTTFLSANEVNPEDINYHMFVGAADGDVSGEPQPVVMSMPIYERAWGYRQLTYVQGAGHNVFNDTSYDEGIGPNRLSRDVVHIISKEYYAALLGYYLKNEVPFLSYLNQHNTLLRPDSIPDNVVISNEYRVHRDALGLLIIDDFQTKADTNKASSGATVDYSVANLIEGILQDSDKWFIYQDDLMNGLTRYLDQIQPPRGASFEWHGQEFYFSYKFTLPIQVKDYKALSLRVAQISRHIHTHKLLADLSFSILLTDAQGETSLISTKSFGVATTPYPRNGGWASEFNTLRIPVNDFKKQNSNLDLSQLKRIDFLFGENYGSERGRIALDDIEFLKE